MYVSRSRTELFSKPKLGIYLIHWDAGCIGLQSSLDPNGLARGESTIQWNQNLIKAYAECQNIKNDFGFAFLIHIYGHIWIILHNLIYLNLYFSQKYRDYTVVFIKEQGQVPAMCNGPSMIKKSNNKKVSVGIFHIFLIDLQYNS